MLKYCGIIFPDANLKALTEKYGNVWGVNPPYHAFREELNDYYTLIESLDGEHKELVRGARLSRIVEKQSQVKFWVDKVSEVG